MKPVRSFVCGFAIATAACCLIANANRYALSPQRLGAVVVSAGAMAQFEYIAPGERFRPWPAGMVIS